ncbi:MAG: D-alanine--D-alanine ligase [Bacilli bacterium]|nr:D-alanine--D-alanine ligase [Bacilli bacterium]
MKKVLILFGGNSYEHDVSCKSCRSILLNIDRSQFQCDVVGISYDNEWFRFNDDLSYLENGSWMDSNVFKIDNIIEYVKGFDVVFPITHGNCGEDGKLQGFLELFDIKFVGADTCSSALCMDKALSKVLFNGADIPQVDYVIIDGEYNVKNIINKLGFPMIVKPARCGSSIGISKANNKRELVRSIREALKYDGKVVVEKFIVARELECAILGNDSLICSKLGEINSCNEFYDYDAKYVNNKSYTTIPDDLPDIIVDKIKNIACKAFRLVGCKDYARVDFFYDESSGTVYLNEINTIPGFTDISMYPKLIENENISYSELISMLINNA